jgi:hypothetical protein
MAKAKASTSVAAFMVSLEHPLKDGIVALRKTILETDAGITEQIKWNAPSFCYGGDDRITFRIPPNGKAEVQLIFHRGAKSKDSETFQFQDPSGFVKWAARDRGVVSFTSIDEITKKTPKLMTLVKAWLEATDPRRS